MAWTLDVCRSVFSFLTRQWLCAVNEDAYTVSLNIKGVHQQPAHSILHAASHNSAFTNAGVLNLLTVAIHSIHGQSMLSVSWHGTLLSTCE